MVDSILTQTKAIEEVCGDCPVETWKDCEKCPRLNVLEVVCYGGNRNSLN